MPVRRFHGPTVSNDIPLWPTLLILVCCSAGLALAASKARDIPPPPPPFPNSTSRPQASQDSPPIETARPILELADAVLPAVPKPATPDNTQTAPINKTTKGGKARMRPSPTKNGRYDSKKLALILRSFVPSNLCAHRWHKQVPSSGSTEEFQKYYSDLTADQRKVSSPISRDVRKLSRWYSHMMTRPLHW